MKARIVRRDYKTNTRFHARGLFDKKGRLVGSMVKPFEDTFVRAIDRDCDVIDGPGEGVWFGMWTAATRDGRKYGAMGPSHYFKTEEERETAIEKYFAAAQKRAQKKWGPPAHQIIDLMAALKAALEPKK